MKNMLYAEGIREAISQEMEKDPTIFIAGEDVSWGGISGQYAGFNEKFSGRIFDTPITETAIAGLGLGSAIMGLRPIIEFNLMDFTLVAMDEICNQIAKYRYMNGGTVNIPLVMLCGCGADMIGSAAQHSQSLESLYAHIPGLKVLYPSNPADAKGLMASAIRDDNPVIFIQHLRLLGERCEVPEGEYYVPIGKAKAVRQGDDVTIISYGAILPRATEAAAMLRSEGISAEVIDLRSIVPLDRETVVSSARKTGRVIIAHEAVRQCGFGAEVAAVIAEEAFDSLKAPVKRLGAPFCPVPFSPELKSRYYVSSDDICRAAEELIRR